MSAEWKSPTMLFTEYGTLRTREEGLIMLLHMALAYTDFVNMQDIEPELQPSVMQSSRLDPDEGQTAVYEGIQVQLQALQTAFQYEDIPPRPTAARRVFNIQPDLHADLVRTITRLRQPQKQRTAIEERLHRPHVREVVFGQRIRENRSARKAVNKRKRDEMEGDGAASAGAAVAAVTAGAAGAAAEPAAEPARKPSKRNRKAPPDVPAVPLLPPPLPGRAARSPPPPDVLHDMRITENASARKRTSKASSRARKAKKTANDTTSDKQKAPSKPRKPRGRASNVRFQDDDLFADNDERDRQVEDEEGEEDFTQDMADVDDQETPSQALLLRVPPLPDQAHLPPLPAHTHEVTLEIPRVCTGTFEGNFTRGY
ncbi:hypothetical protein PENSPDRAFT_694806 [Peniophora sp. CONT]|nr:hypothetical protein PENSPDRAFT_694806 [Peniophora sp. CONT]